MFWVAARLAALVAYAGLGVCIAGIGLVNLILLFSGLGQSKYFDNPILVLSINAVCLGIGALFFSLFYALRKNRKWHGIVLIVSASIWITVAVLAIVPMTFEQFKVNPIENVLYGILGIAVPIVFTVFAVKKQSNLFLQHKIR